MNSLKCPSTEGKNTFGCVVNGKLWLPEGSLGQGATHAEIYKRPDTLAVNIYSSNQSQSIFMSIIDFPDLRLIRHIISPMKNVVDFNS